MSIRSAAQGRPDFSAGATGDQKILLSQEMDGASKISVVTTPVETQIFDDKEIRDTSAHISTIANESKYKVITIYAKNTSNQKVTIQVKGNRENSTTGATNIGTTFEVPASTGIEARTLEPTAEGWLPYLYIEASCSVAPTSGNLNAYAIGRN